MLRFSSAIDETVAYGLDAHETENLYAASSYYASIRSRNNGAFLERYHTAFGDSPPPVNAFGESCYEGIYSLAALIEEAAEPRCAQVDAPLRPDIPAAHGARRSKCDPWSGAGTSIYLAAGRRL